MPPSHNASGDDPITLEQLEQIGKAIEPRTQLIVRDMGHTLRNEFNVRFLALETDCAKRLAEAVTALDAKIAEIGKSVSNLQSAKTKALIGWSSLVFVGGFAGRIAFGWLCKHFGL